MSAKKRPSCINGEYQMVAVDTLLPHPRNPRHGDVGAIYESIQANDFFGALVVQRSTRHVLAGNHRLMAAKQAGMTELPVLWVDCDDDRALRILLADNRTNDLADYNPAALADLLKELAETPDALAGTGYDGDALDELLADMEPEGSDVDAEPQIDKAEELRKKWGTEPGQLWALGDHRLLCGDSTKAEDVARVMGGGRTHLVVTSPPYNCGIEYDEHDDRTSREEYLRFIGIIVARCAEVLEDGCFVAWNVGVSPKTMPLAHARVLEEAGLSFFRQIVWAKVGVAFPTWFNTKRARGYHPNFCHEMIYLFTKGEPAEGGPCDLDDAYSSDVWTVHQSQASADIPGTSNGRRPRVSDHGGAKQAIHPAAYPVRIPAGAIRHLTCSGETVFDPFSGSGTTIIACEQLGRKCRAIEISPAYVAVALERWADATGKVPVLVPGGSEGDG